MRSAFLLSSWSVACWASFKAWCTVCLFSNISAAHGIRAHVMRVRFHACVSHNSPNKAAQRHTHMYIIALGGMSINQCHLAKKGLCVGECDCLCRKAWSMCLIYSSYRGDGVNSSVIIVWMCLCVFNSFNLYTCLPCAFFYCPPSVRADLVLSSSFVLSSFDPIQYLLPVQPGAAWLFISRPFELGSQFIFVFSEAHTTCLPRRFACWQAQVLPLEL